MHEPAMANLRDLGGIPVAGGGRIRAGVLCRGDAPRAGDSGGGLAAWPPRTVVDLRSTGEAADAHPLIAAGATVHHHPLSSDLSVRELASGSGGRFLAGGLAGLYRDTLDRRAAAIAQIAALVADGPGPVLVHCAAGKDRTGVVVAVLLSAVGVAREDVIADYAATDANMPAVVERLGAGESAGVMDVLRTRYPEVFTAPVAAGAAILDALDAAGGAAAWLVDAGLDPAVLERLRARLVEPA